MKLILQIKLFLILVFSSLSSNSQITFRHVYGGTGQDHGRAIQQTPDGGYIVVGSTGSFGNGASDVYLFKIDSLGNQLWSKTYGGPNVDWGYDVKVLPDSGFIIAGYTNSFGNGGYDMYLLRTDSLGDTLWTKTYGGSNWDFGYKVIHTSDNGFAIVGETQSFGAGEKDVYLVKTNQNGDTLWTKTYGGDSVDVGHSLIESSYGGYFITGFTKSFAAGKEDIWIIRTNNQGDTILTQTYGGVESDVGNDIVEAEDSNVVFVATLASFGLGLKDIYACKIDTSGTFIWDNNLGGTNNDHGHSLVMTLDKGFAITGPTTSYGAGLEDFIFYKISENGIYQFAESYGEADSDIPFSIFTDTITNEYIIAGNTKSFGNGFTDVWIIKTDNLGETANNNVDTTADPLFISASIVESAIKVYPNPTHDFVNISIDKPSQIESISILNSIGQSVYYSENINTLNRIHLPHKGLQVARIKFEDGAFVHYKIIVK